MLKEILLLVTVFKLFSCQLEGEYGYTHFEHSQETNKIQGVGYTITKAK